MGQLELREKEIFDALKQLKNCEFVIIGGYAVNAYALPRFSVDCDIVVKDKHEGDKIGRVLWKLNYIKTKLPEKFAYGGNFMRFEKDIGNNFKVNFDILIGEVLDRQTNATFSADWIFNNSEIKRLKGKTIIKELKLRIINVNALFVLKFISCRLTDIRDIFMIAPHTDVVWVKSEISKRYDFNKLFSKVKEKIISKQFRDGLQGVYGFVDERVFDKHQKALLKIGGV